MADRSLRCAVQARTLGYRPAGTAASAATFVLVEAPLPWPDDVSDHPLLAPLRPVLRAHRARLQALVPDGAPDPVDALDGPGATDGSVAVSVRPAGPGVEVAPGAPARSAGGEGVPAGPAGGEGGPAGVEGREGAEPAGPLPAQLRVIVYRQPEGPEPDAGDGHRVDTYVRSEARTPPDRLVATVAALLDGTPGPGLTAAGAEVRDVLVCTHGSRDVCCGSDGTNLYRALKARDLPGLRVWRTSHTGGHRFAPTAVTFPDGRAWAWLDAELLAGIVTRTVPAGVAAGHDRGSAALRDPFVQAADAAVLAAEGWSWLDRPRTARARTVDGDDHRVVTLRPAPGPATAVPSTAPPPSPAPSGPAPTYQAEVVVKRTVPVPDCGRPLDQARKSKPEVEVVALVRHDAPDDGDTDDTDDTDDAHDVHDGDTPNARGTHGGPEGGDA